MWGDFRESAVMGSAIDGGGRGRGPFLTEPYFGNRDGLIRWGKKREPVIGRRGRAGVKGFC